MTYRINGTSSFQPSPQTARPVRKPKIDRQFGAFLDEALQEPQKQSEIKVSHHAQKRMEQRGIQLDAADMNHLEEAFSSLEKKGAHQSLILYDDLSLIASVRNRTIITASKTAEMTEVTNIDSAIHIKR